MSLLATMPLSPLLTAVIETTLNTLINDDPALGRKLLRLKGKVISLHLRELNQSLTFVFSQRIDVMTGLKASRIAIWH